MAAPRDTRFEVSATGLDPRERDESPADALRLLLESEPASALALLRETRLDASCIDRGDVDLLGTPDAVAALTRRAFALARDGVCHARVRRERADKVQLELLSLDLRRRIVFDLWLEVWQLDGGRRGLRFDDVSSRLERRGGLLRMPPDLEASVYVHHLATKRKDLASLAVKARLDHYASACAAADAPDLADALRRLRDEHLPPTELLDQTRAVIRQATGGRPWRRGGPGWRRTWTRGLGSSPFVPRGAPLVAIVGCDGAGKTSLSESIERSDPDHFSARLGKQLYRRWLPFRLLYRGSELTIRTTQERIDELLAPFAFGLAWLSLWKLQLRRNRERDATLVLTDRALMDFLYVERKSDQPRFSWATRVLAPLAVGIPAVHLIVAHDVLRARKDEMTLAGHEAYDADTFRCYTSARAFDYLALANAGSLEPTAGALAAHLRREYGQATASDQATQS